MSDYISREAAIETVKKERDYTGKFTFEEEHAWAVGFQQGITFALSDIASIPAADVVSRGAYDKTDWERCVALTQLKEIGKSFGERMDNVRPVVTCADCKCNNACLTQAFVEDASRVPFDRNTFFCADGKRADDA